MGKRIRPAFYKTSMISILLLACMVVFAAPSFALKALGSKCSAHQECSTGRCDNRPLAGCVPQDGTGNSGEFCSTHQQCRTGLCIISQGRYTGVCSGSNRALGQQCMTHQECSSRRCDNRPGSGCVPQDGTGNTGDFCSTHQQCRSQLCMIASGRFTGQCAASNKPLGSPCSAHGECASLRCDNRSGAGCVSQDGAGKANDFCTTHQQCRSGYCQVTSGLRGTCSANDQPIGRPCHVWSECASKYCDRGVCAQPKSSQVTAANPLKVGLAPQFNANAPNRTIYYKGSSQVVPSSSSKKTVITSVKNTSQYQIQLTYIDKFGKAVGQSVWLNAGASTGAFNGYDATAVWDALSAESGTYVGGNKSISIEISWREQ